MPTKLHAQEIEQVHQFQSWAGYMTSARVSDKFSIWNDFHYVHEGFSVARTGLTYHLPANVSVTAGYAFLGLPTGGISKDLKRREHRPWGQIVINTPIANNWGILNRLRYDARFRGNIQQGDLMPGFTFNHRLRYLISLRRDFPKLELPHNWVPYANISNELLANFGKNVVGHHFDQNRASFSIGARKGGLQIQTGYMNRYLALPAGSTVTNHTLVVWVFHNLDFRK